MSESGDSDREVLQRVRDLLFDETRQSSRVLEDGKDLAAKLDEILASHETFRSMRAENWNDRPLTVAHHKGLRTRMGRDWSPRDLLIEMLRQIDAGVLSPTDVALVFLVPSETSNEGTATVMHWAGQNSMYAQALLCQGMIMKGTG